MRFFAALCIAIIATLSLSHTAYAGGGDGPPKNVLKGVFTQFDPATRTATIKVDGQETPKVLTLGESLKPEDVTLYR